MINGTDRAIPRFNPCEFGKRLQKARKDLNITQEELAERLCVDRNHITRMERGIRVCSIDLLVEIAVLLDVSTDYLLAGTISNTTTKQSLLIAIEELNKIVKDL